MVVSEKDFKDSVLVHLSAVAVNQSALVKGLDTITDALKKFILIVIDIANEKGSIDKESSWYVVGRKEIQSRLIDSNNGASDALIARRLGELKRLNICSYKMENLASSKKLSQYTVESFAPLASIIVKKKLTSKEITDAKKKRRSKTVVYAERDLFTDEKTGILLSGPEDIVFFNEQLFNGILDTTMRVHGRDERKSIEVIYKVAGSPLRIISSCSSREGSSLLIMTDQRVMRCIEAYCKKKIEYMKLKLSDIHGSNFDRSLIPNVFHIDIKELCLLMRMSVTSANLDSVVEMMTRLSETTFEVDASDNKWFQETFSLMFKESGEGVVRSDTYRIQFLTNFESARGVQKLRDVFGESYEIMRPRFYTFSLDHRLFYSLISDDSFNLFLSHEQLSYERSGMIQRLYNWCRAYISGRSKTGVENKWYTLREMHLFLTPGIRLDNFRKHFLIALKKFCIKDSEWVAGVGGTSLIYGYYVYYKRDNGEDLFRIQRDKNDPIVGDNSRHNAIIKQNRIDALESKLEEF